ncbi:uncharacterized protein LOC121240859 [Juglans microcarpa x Juglans regia]|uniref:uncharacterized protein LOC121240859 n=1 Tax=Juglans microcarpa x Juglans regia TaxID=2249226 RepID=UPI001B7EF936|nr:uncharacterized protein LOC121240859 [Juglans microcarpa x Juglans regia]
MVWKSIWKLDVTPVTKMFLWRACNEALSTMANLKRRKLVEDNSCLICTQEAETTGHVLWGCNAAKDVWNQGARKVQKMSHHNDIFFDIWSVMVDTLDPPDLNETKVELLAYNEVLQESQEASVKVQAEVHNWKKPEEEWLKVNWDAAVNSGEGRIGIGVLIKDHNGLVIRALHVNRSLKGNPFDAEAYGLLIAVVFCRELGLQQLCVEGDSKQVVDLMKNHTTNWSMGGCLIGDARQVLDSFTHWTVSHVFQEANSAAHCLANDALGRLEDLYDIEICPPCIFSIVAKEML